MAEFFESGNNGVVALISKNHARIYGQAKKCGGDPIKAGARVFTFCNPERLQRDDDPVPRMVYTGSYEDAQRLLKAGNHEVVYQPSASGWDGYVPFSNGYEYGAHGEGAKEHELRFVTSLSDVLDTFGVA